MATQVKSPTKQGANGHRVDLLRHDRELLSLLSPRGKEETTPRLPVQVLTLERGPWRDTFRAWQEDSPSFSEIAWTVIEPASIAALDGEFKARAREVPELMELFAERAHRRSRRLAVSAAIANTVGVEERLLLLLWQLAELWGRKAPQGALLPYRLSHQTLAELVGARRPTVTLALRSLGERDAVRRDDSGGWILTGDPP